MIYTKTLHRNSQQGFVLVTAIILVLLITILALSMVSLNSTQTRIATNAADSQVAFQTAEAALHQAEDSLISGSISIPSPCGSISVAGVYCAPSATSTPLWASVNWTSTTAAVQTGFTGSSSRQGAYIIEQLPVTTTPIGCTQNVGNKVSWFRITARAVGASGQSPVMLQSVIHTWCT